MQRVQNCESCTTHPRKNLTHNRLQTIASILVQRFKTYFGPYSSVQDFFPFCSLVTSRKRSIGSPPGVMTRSCIGLQERYSVLHVLDFCWGSPERTFKVMERAVPTSCRRTPERALRRRFDDRKNNHERRERKEDISSRNLGRRNVQIA